ncbi:ABC transporter substrate-binding protein [Prosthecomicrobium hirschii]|uniref:ABC transporter substrate-binding protein n=1 Tax=Prosthecodimorpha hirschii TaxID=665126 RepID=UPI001128B90B|nr:ABC transporter substrate-binding protein [Prosthecomicrobium hirschii]MCW1838895.1 ABC transporter substrate-binding protein [Prosthecomicrobium hirschii]TPQ51836.1 ABC transporter substrate-binding protein [Prosthecomicrobium hirschii]
MTAKGWTSAVAFALALGVAGEALAQAPACEPAKLATKYPSLAGKTIKFGADPQTPPYTMRDGADFNKIIGADTDLARAVFDCQGIKYEIFLGGWSGLLPATISGQIDVFWNNLYYTAERAKQVDYVLYMQAGTGALTQAGNPKKIGGLDQTCGTTAAAGLGTVEEAALKKEDEKCKAAGKPGVTVMTYPDLAAGIRLVQTGRADIMMTDLAIVESLAIDNPQTYARAFKILTGFTIGAAVKNGNDELLKAIYEGLVAVQASGGQKAIFQKYKIDPDLQVAAEIKKD